jgi:4-alpha-glucanotransferase
MQVRFSVFCHTDWGQEVYVLGSEPWLGGWDFSRAIKMAYTPGDVWTAVVAVPDGSAAAFEYKYAMGSEAGLLLREEAHGRPFVCDPYPPCASAPEAVLDCMDTWSNPSDPDSLFLTAPFVETIFRRTGDTASANVAVNETEAAPCARIRLQLVNPRVNGSDVVSVTGDIGPLGEWDQAGAVPMDSSRFPYWTLDLTLGEGDIPFTYKYVIKNKGGDVVAYEEGPERSFQLPDAGSPQPGRFAVVTDNKFMHKMKWKGAGIAIPLFSIRSEKGLGVGEFADIKGLVDWARQSGFQLIQMLPINDTSAYMSWMDSYPYSCISVFALHPLYLNLEAMGPLPDGMAGEIALHRTRLNLSPVMEYEEVMEVKRPLLERIFKAKKEAFLSSPGFGDFLEEHGHWLKSYAVFSALRDHFHTGDFVEWGQFSHGKEEDIEALADPGSEHYERVAFYYFLQYHLHVQLSDAAYYAREHGVVLKGDIPIGIQKRSDSCWVRPHLFHMDRSAGAPPDPFSDAGQNWGFPTYNWAEMARDNYSWWRRRMGHMSRYFQMIRLDHVLGFFRIWEIPDESYSGLMGHFNPALPVTKGELEEMGFWDMDRLTEPYIPGWLVKAIFGSEASRVEAHYLDELKPGYYRLKPQFATERQVAEYVNSCRSESEIWNLTLERLKEGLFALILNVLLFKEPSGSAGFHPRINMQDTASFACLEGWMKENLSRLYYDYFYHRQEGFWRGQAMVKLPVLKKVSNMLICGEDLGMIPDCVPGVMEELCLLGLRIQRMPRESDREFGYPWDYSYLTVCSTSSHDMSTIRGWWEEDRERTERYYRKVLRGEGDPPAALEPSIAGEIIRQHLESPSMWAIFPLQDILATSAELRRPGDPREEQINVPADPRHLWKFRLHIPVEKLLEEREFSEKLLEMARDAGRMNAY